MFMLREKHIAVMNGKSQNILHPVQCLIISISKTGVIYVSTTGKTLKQYFS